MSAVLEARALTRRFGDVTALDDVSFAIPAGQVVGLLGHNGAGKTTTIRLLNGLLAPTEGDVRTLGLDPGTNGPSVRARTGVLTETPSLDDRMTARESMTFWADMWNVPRPNVERRVTELLDRFELADRADDRVGGYSRGMRQRLALARTLVHDPPVLFLDEPTAALDPIAALGVRDLVRTLAAGEQRTVLICTHNLVEAQELCDRVIILRRGRVVADGSPSEVVHAAALSIASEISADRATLGAGGAIAIEGMARDAVPQLVRRLVASGAEVYRVSPRQATLEDAYVALYGNEDAA